MAIAVRSATTVALATRTNTTIAAPAGATTGDVITIAIQCGGATLIDPTQPGGWTLIESTSYTAPDPWAVSLTYWVKAYAGETDWTFTHASRGTQAYAVAWTGVDATTPLDVAASKAFQNQGGGATPATAPSITIATAGAQGIIMRGSWDGDPISPPASWTEQLDTPVLWVGNRNWVSSGATGSVAVDAGNIAPTATKPWGVIMGALRPFSGAASVAAVRATITASALAPSVSATGTGSVTAPRAQATATALVPVVSGSAVVSAVHAVVTAAVSVPAGMVSPTVGAPCATISVSALAPVVSAGSPAVVNAVRAVVTTTPGTPSVSISSTVTAVAGVVTATSFAPAVSAGGSGTVTVPAATISVVAYAPTQIIGGSANATVSAVTATVSTLARPAVISNGEEAKGSMSNQDLERAYLLTQSSDPNEDLLSSSDLKDIVYGDIQTPYAADPAAGLSATDVEMAALRAASSNPNKGSMSLADLRREHWESLI